MRIYCDHAATTPVCDEVWQEMEPYLRERFGNASESHWAGREARAGLNAARERCAASIGCAADEVVFTGGGSEADNLALLGRLSATGGRVVASAVEHPAVRAPLRALAGGPVEVVWAPVDERGVIDIGALEQLVRPGDVLCTVIWANNVTGIVQPVDEIARLCAEREVPLHLDAVQACAGLDVDLERLPGQVTVAAAAHKLYGPKGTGLLAGRGIATLAPVLRGGGQERGLRPGTECVASATGLAAALSRAQEDAARHAAARALRDRYEQRVSSELQGVHVIGGDLERLPGHSLLCVEGVRGETVAWQLDAFDIAVSAGSACSAGSAEPSHVLTAMGLERELALGALRVTFGELNSEPDAGTVADAVAGAVGGLRAAAAAV